MLFETATIFWRMWASYINIMPDAANKTLVTHNGKFFLFIIISLPKKHVRNKKDHLNVKKKKKKVLIYVGHPK